MCLENLKTKAELKEFKKTLPKEFFVYKAVVDEMPEFWQKGEPKLLYKKVYEARCFPARRSGGEYEKGFHAFLSEEVAEKYCEIGSWRHKRMKVKKYKAKRSWVTHLGECECVSCGSLPCVVLSHIEVI